MTNVLEVDVVQVLHDWLTTQLDGVRVVSTTPADLAQQVPLLRVLRIGGPDDGVILDSPTVAIHAFTTSAPTANALLYQVNTALRAARGVIISGAVITQVRKLGGPSWAPTAEQKLAHSVSTYQIRIKVA